MTSHNFTSLHFTSRHFTSLHFKQSPQLRRAGSIRFLCNYEGEGNASSKIIKLKANQFYLEPNEKGQEDLLARNSLATPHHHHISSGGGAESNKQKGL
jgi:hypothetical protein